MKVIVLIFQKNLNIKQKSLVKKIYKNRVLKLKYGVSKRPPLKYKQITV